MSIHSNYYGGAKETTVSCNSGASKKCWGDLTYGETSFKSILQDIKNKGWTVKKDLATWQNFCPECSKLNKEAQDE